MKQTKWGGVEKVESLRHLLATMLETRQRYGYCEIWGISCGKKADKRERWSYKGYGKKTSYWSGRFPFERSWRASLASGIVFNPLPLFRGERFAKHKSISFAMRTQWVERRCRGTTAKKKKLEWKRCHSPSRLQSFVEIGMGMKVLWHGAHTHTPITTFAATQTHKAFGVKVRHSRSGRKKRWKRNENKLLILIMSGRN